MAVNRNLCLYLTEEQYSFLQNIAEKCASDGGTGLPEAAILRTLIQLLQHLEVDVTEIRTEDELLQRLEDAVEAEILSELSQVAIGV